MIIVIAIASFLTGIFVGDSLAVWIRGGVITRGRWTTPLKQTRARRCLAHLSVSSQSG
jgi:hypothetical protein